MIKNIPFQKGEKYTIYTISEMMATTIKREVEVTKLHDDSVFKRRTSYDKPSVLGHWEFGEYHLNGGRKTYCLTVRPTQDVVILGWGHLATDIGEYRSFTGNACINIAGTPDQVRELIEKNINSNFSRFDIILAAPVSLAEADYLEVYPDTPTSHAKILEKRAKLEN